MRFKCKDSSRSQCATNMCSSSKYGFPCVTACGECRGVDCYNATKEDRNHMEDVDDRSLFETLFS